MTVLTVFRTIRNKVFGNFCSCKDNSNFCCVVVWLSSLGYLHLTCPKYSTKKKVAHEIVV